MREEIRLGNEALAQDDMETAKQHFQQLLTAGGTATQERIAANRLREIHEKEEALRNPQAAKTRARRKTTRVKKNVEESEHKVIRPPDNPVVVIKKH